MIRYTLHCPAGHDFDSWFQSAEAVDKQLTAGQVACPICGMTTVDKALMAPALRAGLRDTPTERETALAALRAEIEAKSEYVGVNFVAQARAMHQGDMPERSIYGEARPEEAIKLLEEGVSLAPLPFMPVRKVN